MGSSQKREGEHALRYEDDEDKIWPCAGGIVDNLPCVGKVIKRLPRDYPDGLPESHEHPEGGVGHVEGRERVCDGNVQRKIESVPRSQPRDIQRYAADGVEKKSAQDCQNLKHHIHENQADGAIKTGSLPKDSGCVYEENTQTGLEKIDGLHLVSPSLFPLYFCISWC